jgi:hypothetical protein
VNEKPVMSQPLFTLGEDTRTSVHALVTPHLQGLYKVFGVPDWCRSGQDMLISWGQIWVSLGQGDEL